MKRRQFCSKLIAGWGLTTFSPLFAALPNNEELSSQLDLTLAKRVQEKIENYDKNFDDDIFLSEQELPVFNLVLSRLNRAQAHIGFGRFNLLSLDELLKAAAESSRIGAFTSEELSFIEEIFFADAKRYGFYGEKVISSLTERIPEKATVKIAGSGHFLFRGRPETFYQKIIKDVGSDIILTSGIRSVVKQLHLFLAKAALCQGNLSRASRSLAPPGHSFHGSGDFDVGKIGLGYRNFTDHFAETDVFKKLIDLGYVDIRYTRTNPFGVRFEPWHIKVT